LRAPLFFALRGLGATHQSVLPTLAGRIRRDLCMQQFPYNFKAQAMLLQGD